jgi:hypothetical protein
MPTYFKFLVFLAISLIIYNLAKAFFYLFRRDGSSHQVVKALTLRIGLSICLFIMLFIAYGVGILQPHSL